jgi:hypothetical protein
MDKLETTYWPQLTRITFPFHGLMDGSRFLCAVGQTVVLAFRSGQKLWSVAVLKPACLKATYRKIKLPVITWWSTNNGEYCKD